jgi:hypothetical protein
MLDDDSWLWAEKELIEAEKSRSWDWGCSWIFETQPSPSQSFRVPVRDMF